MRIRPAPKSFWYSASRLTGKPASCSPSRRQHTRVTPRHRMKLAHSMMLFNDGSGIRAPYTVGSPLRAGPKWKLESISFIQVGRPHTLCETGRLISVDAHAYLLHPVYAPIDQSGGLPFLKT